MFSQFSQESHNYGIHPIHVLRTGKGQKLFLRTLFQQY